MHNINIDAILSEEQLVDFQSATIVAKVMPAEIFEVLQCSGFLIQAVPEELGGLGLTRIEVSQQLRCLEHYSPAIAQAANSHIACTGVAADRWYAGDTSLEWLLRDACDGQFFATGYRDILDDNSLMKSLCKVERADGGYCFSGQLRVDSATTTWSRLCISGRENANIGKTAIIHAFVAHDAQGLTIDADGGVMLDAAFVPNKYIAQVIDKPSTDQDLFLRAKSVWMFTGYNNV